MTQAHRLTTLACLVAVGTATIQAAEDQVDFNRQIRPILADHCYRCHGPDEAAREAGLRLDRADDARRDLGGYRAVVPGNPADSVLVQRVFSDDADLQMPPPAAHKPLAPPQKELLRRWIAEGAPYAEHWAFVPPRRPPLPEVKNAAWTRNEIDRFLLARIEGQGLTPSAEADRYTLLRRLYLDLLGLLPTPAEADAFAQDSSPDAYERVVDRLLNSPRYGERWARRWLDLARYADTNGYEKDRDRSIWPYRDWVIQALNDDLPFDRFTIEQIAGDLLPEPTVAQRIATGFHRNTMLNEEGGIDPLEFRFYALTDRVATTGTTWLGLTLGCAQCHHHKYDPISHREYYQLMAFLNNADEPEWDLPDPAQDEAQRRNLQESERLLGELPDQWPVEATAGPPSAELRREASERAFAQWLQRERARTVTWTPLRPRRATSNLPLLTVQADDSVFASGDTTKVDTYQLTIPVVTGLTAVRLEALPDERLPAHGPGMTYYEGEKGDFFLGEFRLLADGAPLAFARASESYAKNRFGNTPVSAQLATDGDPQTGWSVSGRTGQRHVAVFVLAQPLPPAGSLQVEMVFGRHCASSLGRFRLSGTTDPRDAQARDLPADVEDLLAIPDGELTDAQRKRLRDEFLLQTPELAEPAKRIRQLRQRPAYTTTLVMQERPPENPRPTFVHRRGEFLQPAEPVEPGTPAALPGLPADAPRNRLGFARWLVSPGNPLTARVTVNRQWAAFFGRGLVRTAEDFGLQGEPPTHPELLDWLAVDFVEHGWSLKRLHKQIVMSAAYRQSSQVTAQRQDRDPDNRWLSRSPRFRLEAEILRDATLQAAGLLSFKTGGPPVYPPQPPGVTEVAYGKPGWNPSAGEDRYRRSVYTFLKRTAPFAMYNTFDAPSGEACVARRDVSNTALQALTILNDVLFVEAAQALGRELAAGAGDPESRVRWAFRRVLVRPPADDELRLLTEFLQNQQRRLAAGELDARAIAGDGPGEPGDRAAWTALARALFSLDESVTRP